MSWKVFSHHVVWKLKVNKINCLSWKLKPWFSPLGVRVFILFIRIIFALILKLWPDEIFIRLYRFAWSSSFLWLLRQKLKDPSFFLTYWILQRLHSNRWIIHLILQLMLWNMLDSGFFCVLLKKFVSITCLQHCSWTRQEWRQL